MIEDNADLIGNYIPEVQSNLGYALPAFYARDLNDVAAIPGRIVRYMGKARPSGPPTFGASSHVANYILTAMKYDPEVRSAMNIKYDDRVIEAAKELGYVLVVTIGGRNHLRLRLGKALQYPGVPSRP